MGTILHPVERRARDLKSHEATPRRSRSRVQSHHGRGGVYLGNRYVFSIPMAQQPDISSAYTLALYGDRHAGHLHYAVPRGCVAEMRCSTGSSPVHWEVRPRRALCPNL